MKLLIRNLGQFNHWRRIERLIPTIRQCSVVRYRHWQSQRYFKRLWLCRNVKSWWG